MGKRRSLKPLNPDDRYKNDDDADENDDEENEDNECEPLKPEEALAIQGRKKLVAKRRKPAVMSEANVSTGFASSPFASFSLTKNGETPNLAFTGFKGFSSFKPSETTSENTNTSSNPSQFKFSASNPNGNQFSSSNASDKPITTSNTITSVPFSFGSQISNDNSKEKLKETTNGNSSQASITSSNSSSFPAVTTKSSTTLATINEQETTVNSSTSASGKQMTKNLNENEITFMNALNELMTSSFNGTKRAYKLPIEILNSSNIDSLGSEDDKKTKYGYMLAELNRNCAKWIGKHVDESPYVNLTPVFVSYFNYLILLEKQFFPETFQSSRLLNMEEKENKQQLQTQSSTKSSFIINNGEADKRSLTNGHHTNKITRKDEVVSSVVDEAQKADEEEEQRKLLESSKKFASLLKSSSSQVPSFGNLTSKSSDTLQVGSESSTPTPFKFGSFSATTTTKDESKPGEDKAKANPLSSMPHITSQPLFSFGSKKEEEKKSDSKVSTSSSSSLFGSSEALGKKNDSETAKTSSIFGLASNTATSTGSSLFASLTKQTNTSSSNESGETTMSKPFFSFQQIATNKIDLKSGSSLFGSSFGSATSTGSSLFGGDQQASAGDADEEPYEPPKPETCDVQEEGSVFTKRLKLFFFKEQENKFCERGIGNLYIKPSTASNGKMNLIIRSDTKLAKILLNVSLSKVIPINKIGAKDVSFICLANPEIPEIDNKKPCRFLFKVKTEDDANELFEKLNEYKS